MAGNPGDSHYYSKVFQRSYPNQTYTQTARILDAKFSSAESIDFTQPKLMILSIVGFNKTGKHHVLAFIFPGIIFSDPITIKIAVDSK